MKMLDIYNQVIDCIIYEIISINYNMHKFKKA